MTKYIWSGVLLLLLLGACKQGSTGGAEHIVAVSVPAQKYFVEHIVGEALAVHVMVPAGSNPELYDPTPSEVETLMRSDIYLYLGTLPFEQEWVSMLQESNSQAKLLDISAQLPQEIVFGADAEFAHVHVHGDPHYWTSIKGAREMASVMYQALVEQYPELKEQFTEGYQRLTQEIDEVEKSALDQFQGSEHGASFVIYHPSLSLFAEEFGLHQLVIEENGVEPTARHLARLISTAGEEQARVVFIQEEFDVRQAESIAKTLGIPMVTIRPMDENWKEQMMRIISAFQVTE